MPVCLDARVKNLLVWTPPHTIWLHMCYAQHSLLLPGLVQASYVAYSDLLGVENRYCFELRQTLDLNANKNVKSDVITPKF